MRSVLIRFLICFMTLSTGFYVQAEGNGVERGDALIDWQEVAGLIRPELRAAIAQALQQECPQLAMSTRGQGLVVNSVRMIPADAQNSEINGAPVIELTLRVPAAEDRRFKVRMVAQAGVMHAGSLASPEEANPKVLILEWIGTHACFGQVFGLPHEKQ